jgi:hypothetical protein
MVLHATLRGICNLAIEQSSNVIPDPQHSNCVESNQADCDHSPRTADYLLAWFARKLNSDCLMKCTSSAATPCMTYGCRLRRAASM